jgi:hypothetical protein
VPASTPRSTPLSFRKLSNSKGSLSLFGRPTELIETEKCDSRLVWNFVDWHRVVRVSHEIARSVDTEHVVEQGATIRHLISVFSRTTALRGDEESRAAIVIGAEQKIFHPSSECLHFIKRVCNGVGSNCPPKF